MAGLEFQYALGRIKEIITGDSEKFSSFDKLDFKQEKGIYVPEYVGVYQKESHELPEEVSEMYGNLEEEIDQQLIMMQEGQAEDISPDLICIAYDPDPSTLNAYKNLLEQSLKEDILSRIKVVPSLEIPRFSDKKSPIKEIVPHLLSYFKNIKDSESNLAVLERDREVLKNLKKDYGLTRNEATSLLIVNNVLSNSGRIPKIRLNPLEKIIGDFITGFGTDEISE